METIGEQCRQQGAQLSGTRHELNVLEQSLVVSEERVKGRDVLIVQEKNRVAVLENFIRSHSLKQEKQATLIQQKQLETLTKINSMFDNVTSCLKASYSTVKAELEPELGSCLEILRSLSSRETAKSINLTGLGDSVNALSSRWVLSW
jgi:hypothetical protein